MRIFPALVAGAALLAGLPAVAKTDNAKGEAALAKALAGRVAGKPVSCINLRDIRSTTIIDGTAILYYAGSTIYVNRPADPGSLDDDDVMVTKTSLSQLCNVDVVHLVDRSTRFPSGFVNLSKFVPYTKPGKAR
ncbi:hypothetical protein [Sphingobium nicotianae]|uniref:Uncharacterized protein n=1 Tax=Sphingobium nicotianae TaxID=2782607 RepID=A0A9X1ISY7_9SPHN|nr:hypothetical protein [Sphingobium nicotianae]MBT2188802.1 hypothetical protein [Sphingobium nicotianae]